MINILTKKLEELKTQLQTHQQNYTQLSQARDKARATINATLGAIEAVEALIKEYNEKQKKEQEK